MGTRSLTAQEEDGFTLGDVDLASLVDEATHVMTETPVAVEEDIPLDDCEENWKAFAEVIKSSKTILMNGPVGAFENPVFAEGTKAVLAAIVEATKAGAVSVIGGGDSVSAAKQFCNAEDFTHVSTGGGASLEFIEGKVLPGVAALDEV